MTTVKRSSATSAPFGALPSGGAPVRIYTLTNADGIEVRTIPYGAIIVSLRVPAAAISWGTG